MAEWRVEFDAAAAKELKKLGKTDQGRILKFLRERIAGEEDPRRLGAALSGEFAGLWRYRVGDHRLVVAIEDQRILVLVLRIGHRREIYR
ncbi:MAG: type II toxin-antitoxin system RelE family toxin [Parvularculaceae bacterium]